MVGKRLTGYVLWTLGWALMACGGPQGPVAATPGEGAPDALPAEVSPSELGEQVFRFAIAARPRTMDPALVRDSMSAQVVVNAFEGLLVRDGAGQRLRLGMAADYRISEDQRVYRFVLRDDARWSDGVALTAQDFVHAWKRVLYPSTASEYAWLLTEAAQVKGAHAFNTGRSGGEDLGIRAIDAKTLEIELVEPVPYFLELLAFPTLMPIPSHRDIAGEPWCQSDAWVSNGAYVVSAASSPNRYVLVANPYHWSHETLQVEQLELHVIESDVERVAAFERGEIDWTGPQPLPLQQVHRMAERPEFRQEPYLGVEYLLLNTRSGPLADQRVRQALMMVLDRDEVLMRALSGVGQAAYGFVPPLTGYSTSVRAQRDVVAAKGLLSEAGYGEGTSFPTLTYLYPASNSNAERVAEVVVNQWQSQLGIRVGKEAVPLGELSDRIHRGDFAIARAAWAADFLDPVSFLGIWTSDSPNNSTGWKDLGYDGLLSQARSAGDRAQRFAIYAQAEALLSEHVPVIPLFYGAQTFLLANHVRGFVANRMNLHVLRELALIGR